MKARILERRSNRLVYIFSGYKELKYDRKEKMWTLVSKEDMTFKFPKEVYKVKTSWK